VESSGLHIKVLLACCFIKKFIRRFSNLRYNIREVFEVYRNERDPDKIKQLVSDGWENAETLKKLSKWTPETWTFGMQ
jgi:hypothetical protein